MEISFSRLSLPTSGAVVVPLTEGAVLGAKALELDKAASGAMKRAIKQAGFKGKKGENIVIVAPHGVKCETIVVFGLGSEDKLSELSVNEAGGQLTTALNKAKIKKAAILCEFPAKAPIDAHVIAASLAEGMKLKSYRFDRYRTKEKQEQKPTLTTVTLLVKDQSKASKLYATLEAVVSGVFFARDLVSEPPNVLYPDSYAERIKEDLTKLGVKVEILNVKKMEQLGMGALLGVGQGSVRESRLVVMRWVGHPKGEKEKPIAFVGKGVTFDTGGISLKPSKGMEDMKYDMGGSGAVVGAMKALATRKAKANVVGIVGLVENMPGGNAQRPSDVVTTMSGQTIEVLNTDAEGRLVLSDALWYTQDRFNPKFMIDLATLTGAITIALGDQYAGLFSNNDELSKKLTAAGESVGERLWRFPMSDEYDKMIDSKIADVANVSDGRGAGSITAAQFLQRFVNKTPWAHLDIAGMAWAHRSRDIIPEGASAYGVRLLNKFIADYVE